ncbi:MAG: ImmA/IrrE family metallo-endopeptidase [Alphaproteobacteria bacterium]|nr:ImmA/IrrE family metallo-endopeptidase [Alphaproteobacteria bacterium]
MTQVPETPQPKGTRKATSTKAKRDTASSFKQEIKAELTRADLKPNEVFKLIPEDWLEIAQSEGGRYEIRSLIAHSFGLGIDQNLRLVAKNFPNARFRSAKNSDPGKMRSAANCAATIARLVLRAMPQGRRERTNSAPRPVPEAQELRQLLLEDGKPWIDLGVLADYCWSIDIPVLYLPNLPASGKMTGMVVRDKDQFAIVLSKKATNDIGSYQLFTLAHELGHIACGHLTADTPFLAEIDQDRVRSNDSIHEEEKQANRYAEELLLGKSFIMKQPIDSASLATIANEKSKQHKIDPGLILLNLAKTSQEVLGANYWGLITNAIKSLNNRPPHCQELLRSKLYDKINIDELKLETWELLTRLKVLPTRTIDES